VNSIGDGLVIVSRFQLLLRLYKVTCANTGQGRDRDRTIVASRKSMRSTRCWGLTLVPVDIIKLLTLACGTLMPMDEMRTYLHKVELKLTGRRCIHDAMHSSCRKSTHLELACHSSFLHDEPSADVLCRPARGDPRTRIIELWTEIGV